MPALLQASMSSVPAGAVSFLPSTVRFTSAIGNLVRHHRQAFRRAFFLIPARPAFQMILKLFSKLFHKSNCRHRRRIAQRAERPAQHVLRQVLHVVDVFFHPAAGVKTYERLFKPVSAFAAGKTPSTTFMPIKLHRRSGRDMTRRPAPPP